MKEQIAPETVLMTETIRTSPLTIYAHEVVHLCHQLTSRFPTEERSGLGGTIRHTAIKMTTSVIKALKYKSIREKITELINAQATLEELKYLIFLSAELRYGHHTELPEVFQRLEDLLQESIKQTQNNLSLSF